MNVVSEATRALTSVMRAVAPHVLTWRQICAFLGHTAATVCVEGGGWVCVVCVEGWGVGERGMLTGRGVPSPLSARPDARCVAALVMSCG